MNDLTKALAALIDCLDDLDIDLHLKLQLMLYLHHSLQSTQTLNENCETLDRARLEKRYKPWNRRS